MSEGLYKNNQRLTITANKKETRSKGIRQVEQIPSVTSVET